jgi:mannose-6-phosphate isomerase-like protein (cupin superfamily)
MMVEKTHKWKPDVSFRELVNGEFKGVLRAKTALKAAGITLGDSIITSRDPRMVKVIQKLRSTNPPEGLEQWQLPIFSNDRTALYFISVACPNAKVPPHKHHDDDVFRIVLSGSLIFKKIELTAGDWMFIPKGVPYSFEAGRLGSVILHTYH